MNETNRTFFLMKASNEKNLAEIVIRQHKVIREQRLHEIFCVEYNLFLPDKLKKRTLFQV